MTQKAFFLLYLIIFFVVVDYYVFQAVKTAFHNISPSLRSLILWGYWGFTIVTFICFFYYHFGLNIQANKALRMYLMTGIFMNYFSKIIIVIFLFIDDIIRLGKWALSFEVQMTNEIVVKSANIITRSEFLSQTGIIVATIPLVTMGYGLIKGAHDYRIIRQQLILPNLPKVFDGITIGQISDIHAGSFLNKKAVIAGVEMLMNEKPDMIFQTGDIVNYEAKELNDYINVFDKVKAPLGVYTIFGNHDYGEYKRWKSEKERLENLEDLKRIYKLLGWRLLLNENICIDQSGIPASGKLSGEQSGEKIAIIGVENWGRMNWSQKYSNIEKALKGTENVAIKLLLSHDPSHWEAQILNTDVNVTFSGHTHGFQFGIEIGSFKWSPAQYLYKQWAGLYKKNNHLLYVNRGFGFLGFPGRIGMAPEITIFKLKIA